jgi:hypothetical protein
MKTTTILFTLTVICNCIFAQQTFAPIGSKWYYSSASQGTAHPDAAYWLYETTGDTLVQNILSKKTTIKYFNHLGDTLTNFPPILSYTNADTVFYYNSFMGKFTPLYIFNVQAGDTITLYKPHNPVFGIDTTFRLLIDSVNFIQVNNFNLKRVYTSQIDEFKFSGAYVERLGCLGLMLPEYHISIPETEGPLRCYSDADVNVNFTSNSCDYRLTVGINTLLDQQDIHFYPNPTNNKLYFSSNASDFKLITICNLQGSQTKQIDLENTNDKVIDVASLPTGLYFVTLTKHNGQSVTKKIIIK